MILQLGGVENLIAGIAAIVASEDFVEEIRKGKFNLWYQ